MPRTATRRRRPGRPPVSKRQAGASRQELIDAAVAVFAGRGYEAATVEEVIVRAGLSKGTFYYNFGGKEDLFAAVLEARLDAPMRDLMAITEEAPGDVPTAATVSAGLADVFRAERDALLLLEDYVAQAARHPDVAERYRARQASLRDALAGVLAARHEHTGVPLTFDAHRLAEGFIALAQGLAFESLVDPDVVDPQLFGDMLSLVYDGLVQRATS